jgi:hypothetical protein
MVTAFHTRMKERMDKSGIAEKDLAYALMMVGATLGSWKGRL